MIIGIGLDSDGYDMPPISSNAQKQVALSLQLIAIYNQKDTHHIGQVTSVTCVDRIDHSLNAADGDELMESVKQNGVGMAICPCAYVRHTPEGEMFPRKKKLFDDPVYMEDNWLGDNVILVRDKCGFTDREMLQLQMSALEMF
jgi:adenosine deaminase